MDCQQVPQRKGAKVMRPLTSSSASIIMSDNIIPTLFPSLEDKTFKVDHILTIYATSQSHPPVHHVDMPLDMPSVTMPTSDILVPTMP